MEVNKPPKSIKSSYHEVPDGPVEDCPVIISFFTQTDEILSSFGDLEKREITEMCYKMCKLSLKHRQCPPYRLKVCLCTKIKHM